MISRRDVAVTLMSLVPIFCYIIYLYELQDHSIFVAHKYGIHTDLSVQGALYYWTGIVEIGVLGIGLTASVLTLYRAKSMDRTQLKLVLAGSATLVSLLLIGLNLYYRYYIGLLGL
jgi:formate-dependent nitrite reductase membrane component NrfD